VDGEELAQQREAEGRAAAAVLCLSGWDCLGYSDGEVDRVPLRRDLVGEIRTFRPSVVVAPDPTSVFFGSGYVNHRDHLEVGWAALEAVTPDAANPNYCPDLGEPHAVGEVLLSGSLAADYAVDIASQRERKAAALGCHLSQLGGGSELGVDESVLAEMVSARAMAEGKSLGVAYAESFRRLRFGAA
jgi:LmbE family N-acetylglucosaminyl deacetylase